jgi:dethiobiotin synthetase
VRIVVTGTDTGVGKTYAAAALCDAHTTYVKAAQTGDDDDVDQITSALVGAVAESAR